jgi:hypothetical protein
MPIDANDIKTQSLPEEGVYLFCFTRSGRLPELKISGLDDHFTVTQREFREIAAVYAKVALADFSGPSAEARLQDLAWVGPRAFRHEKVIETVMGYSSVFPARFGTIFSSLRRLDEILNIHYDRIARFLEAVGHKAEWAVKGFLDREQSRRTIVSKALAEAEERLAALTPGMRYFQEKRIASEAEKELNRGLKDILDMIINGLEPFVADFNIRKVLSHDATGKDSEMIVNWAFLVTRSAEVDFHARVERANAQYTKQGLNFEMSGPWPPYSFCPTLG